MGLELFSSDYFPRAGAGPFRLQFLLPELELELLSSEFCHRARAGAYKILIFILELDLKVRVFRVFFIFIFKPKVKPMIYVPNELRDTNKTLFFYKFSATIVVMSDNTKNKPLIIGFKNTHLSFYLQQTYMLN